MYVCSLILFLCYAISPAVSSVAKDRSNACSNDEYSCSDGTCISLSAICDGSRDCSDGSDEAVCFPGSNSSGQSGDLVVHRSRRQASKCRKNQWQCRDGSCISLNRKCDGTQDCPDKSDETFPLCRKTICQPNWFRCAYGACVAGTAPCNKFVECFDSSDELLPQCRNETDEEKDRFRCNDGSYIPISDYCDGVPNCPDFSDETIRACAVVTCPSYLFQCAYGACVDEGADCNGKIQCADGSDESNDLCHKTLPVNPVALSLSVQSGTCVLPPYPAHGTYVMTNAPYALPGQGFQSLQLTVTCWPGYKISNTDLVVCQGGIWSHDIPKCIRLCKLDKDPSVNYTCLVYGAEEGHRDCETYELSGTVVRAKCNTPYYYSEIPLPNMKCVDGSWNYVAVCTAECGLSTPLGVNLKLSDDRYAKRGEVPWYVGIHRKATSSYVQMCGGSLVTEKVVISAAHCFWNQVSKIQPASNYVVTAGKIYRAYDFALEKYAQKSDIKEINIPERFQGAVPNFRNNIAILIVQTAFVYQKFVKPVCLDFDMSFDGRQLQQGKLGMVAVFGLIDGKPSEVLRAGKLPFVNIEQCIESFPISFREHVTSDKICAGFTNDTSLCRSDSGSGIAFPAFQRGTERFYLRGILSGTPYRDQLCNVKTLSVYTHIVKHEQFIKKYL